MKCDHSKTLEAHSHPEIFKCAKCNQWVLDLLPHERKENRPKERLWTKKNTVST